MIARIIASLRFCYDFVVGDDWRVALGVAAALALTYGVSTTSIPAWWIVPAAVAILLPASLWREIRRRGIRLWSDPRR